VADSLSKEGFVGGVHKYWSQVVLVLGLILSAVGLGSVFVPDFSSSEVEIIKADEVEDREEIMVDIEGAVIKPGVYTLPFNSRLNDLLIACGGLSEEADRSWVEKNLNKAATLSDGAKIYIPSQGEEVKGVKEGGVINLNSATLSELETLPGVGPSMGQKIINYREESGGFSSVEELMSVPGIGKKTFEELKDLVSIY